MEEQNKHEFRIKFEKDQHSIDIDTYIQSLSSFGVLVKEINYQEAQGSSDISVSVLAQEPGSFDVLLQVSEAIQNIRDMVPPTVDFLAGIVTIASGIFAYKKYKKHADESKTEISGNNVILKDSDGNTIHNTTTTIVNLYSNNQAINDAVSNQFQAINKDPEIQGMKITNGDTEVTFNRDDFDILSERHTIETGDDEVSTVATDLVISKLVLDDKNRKWEFVYQGAKISAKISDDKFWEEIFSGRESFANGDKLIADLEITREYDPGIGVYLNKEFTVINVRQHLPRENHEQTTLIK